MCESGICIWRMIGLSHVIALVSHMLLHVHSLLVHGSEQNIFLRLAVLG